MRVSADKLAVLVSFSCDTYDMDALEGFLTSELRRLRVTHVPERADISAAYAAATMNGGSIEGYAIVRGKPSEPPVDGRVEWTQDFFSTAFATDSKTGNIDYRTRVGNPTVVQGQVLARIREPIEGVPGSDVFGKPIRVAKPHVARLRAGRNVQEEPSTREFMAATNGRVRMFQGTLSIDEVFELRESVGLRTGNIFHHGALRIHGDILAESRVKADGDIEVDGLIEPCNVECGGSLIVHGGITGHDEHSIVVAGGVQAKYINQLHLEAGHDVAVAGEIRNSVINTRGTLHAHGAKVIGGVVNALAGIDALETGSDGRVNTRLVVGHDFKLEHEIHQRDRVIAEHHTARDRITHVLDSLLPHLDTLPQNKRDAAEALLENVHNIDMQIRVVEEEIEALRKESASRAKPQIIVRNKMHAETMIQIDSARLRIETDTPGPVRAVLKDGEVKLIYGLPAPEPVPASFETPPPHRP